ncbi:uncharacterized protein si:dkey-172o19.2 [Xyrichtys novacula]|uniref:Uncharacterized protein si:dkey-172o19.2 n=1 Tax=Xyrichtys novacula TaxID=13765 RepID=A0AAV1FHQ8_XYRNO|nr:uncharacterized protein si:dkey-172o19.2 [Xyrichtys novacula]
MSARRSPDAPEVTSPCLPSSSSVDSSGSTGPDLDPGTLLPVVPPPLLTRRLLRLRTYSSPPSTRRKREMIPTDKKDATYWDKRQRNNEAAKRSREKRRLQDLMLEGQALALRDENAQLRAQLLSLQYHCNLEKSDPRAACATPDYAWLFPPRPPYPPTLFQGLWSNRNNQVSALGMGQQEAAMHPFKAKTPCFTSSLEISPGAQQGISSYSGQRFISPGAVSGVRRSAEAEMDPQRQVSSSDDILSSSEAPIPSSFARGFPNTVPQLSTLPQKWLLPTVSHPSVCNDTLLPWRASYLSAPAVYPGLPPLYVQDRAGQGLSVETGFQRGIRSLLSSAPAGVKQPGMHLNPYGP